MGISRSSALKFNSADSRSIIREGAGWYDEKAQRFRIVVDVHNKTWGPLFGYRGSFEAE